ncbi:MAG: hypothetical protein WC007_03035 [Pelobacteraceae bacterium]
MALLMTKKNRVPETPEAMPQTAAEKSQSVGRGRDETVRISFRMGKDLHKRLKLAAVMQGRSIVSMLEGFVAAHTPAV